MTSRFFLEHTHVFMKLVEKQDCESCDVSYPSSMRSTNPYSIDVFVFSRRIAFNKNFVF